MKKGEIPYDFEKADQYGFGKALYLIDGIQGLDDESIKRACKVVTKSLCGKPIPLGVG